MIKFVFIFFEELQMQLGKLVSSFGHFEISKCLV